MTKKKIAIHHLINKKNFDTQQNNNIELANLLEFKAHTEQRIKAFEITSKELQDSSNNNHLEKKPLKKLIVVLKKLSPSHETNGIKTEPVWSASYKGALNKSPEAVNPLIVPQYVTKKIAKLHENRQTPGNKRKSFDTIFSIPAKKIKWRIRWKTECTKLLNEFEQLGIKYRHCHLSDKNPSSQILNKYKAILASNFALDIIEKLSFPNKNIADTEKLYRLEEAQNGLSNAIDFYKKAELAEKKKMTIQCRNILVSTIEKLKVNKIPIANPISSADKKSSCEKRIASNGHVHQPIRYTRTFFRQLSDPKNNVTQVDNQNALVTSAWGLITH